MDRKVGSLDPSKNKDLRSLQKKPETDPCLYKRLIDIGKTHKYAAEKAGYSEKTPARDILKNKKIQAMMAISSVDDARKALQKTKGHTYINNADRLVDMMQNEETADNVKIAAIREHNSMQGYGSPKELKSQNLHLHADLEGFTAEELEYMATHDDKGNELDTEEGEYEEV